MAFLPGSMWFLRRFSWRLVVLSLRSHDASTACIELSRRAHCVYTGRSRCSHCTDGVLFAFHARTQRLLRIGVPPSSSAKPAYRQTVIPLDGVHQLWHSIFPKPKSCIVQTGINNTLFLPLTQIYVINIPLLTLVQMKTFLK